MRNKHHTSGQTLLLACLKNPERLTELSSSQWSLLLRMARACKLIAHFAGLIEQYTLSYCVPEKISNHLIAAQAIIAYRQRMAFWELNRLQRALTQCKTDIIVLKGCAYLLLDIPFAKTRVFADIDVMVNKSIINTIEQSLLAQDWHALKLNDYDQYYYREWMHEIPPLCHRLREMEVDIHHTIIPPTSALCPDPSLLFHDAVSLNVDTAFKVLSPCDMVLHSAVHLFFDSELNNKLRDLVDLDQLFRHFSTDNTTFFASLLARATVLGLQRPLYYSMRYTHRLLNTPIPKDILQASQTMAPVLPTRLLMDYLIPIALLPEHPDETSLTVAVARWLLFIRSHYLRMPLALLIPHLARKSLMRLIPSKNLN
ncbi:nucleotidyltransferase family protein [Crenothrix polyspora]|uniref:Nucleotidyltransferase family protein n=1 Tax=Crenothrix polyspora TaxID=360316 RepID=A0A1R4H127_9GAMM|nr:nucleotidyltransferase family protein [Crenothrix polyspora]SJM89934.1 conserved hypothetical protein [Crenothrix polyspora]